MKSRRRAASSPHRRIARHDESLVPATRLRFAPRQRDVNRTQLVDRKRLTDRSTRPNGLSSWGNRPAQYRTLRCRARRRLRADGREQSRRPRASAASWSRTTRAMAMARGTRSALTPHCHLRADDPEQRQGGVGEVAAVNLYSSGASIPTPGGDMKVSRRDLLAGAAGAVVLGTTAQGPTTQRPIRARSAASRPARSASAPPPRRLRAHRRAAPPRLARRTRT